MWKTESVLTGIHRNRRKGKAMKNHSMCWDQSIERKGIEIQSQVKRQHNIEIENWFFKFTISTQIREILLCSLVLKFYMDNFG